MTADSALTLAASARLAELRERYVPMTAEEARLAMSAGDAPRDPMSPAAVSARLAELRALDELTTHLHRAGKP